MAEPITILMLRLASHPRPATIRINSGQGVASSTRSNQIRNWSRGSKKFSILSPYSRVKDLNPSSIPLRRSRRSRRPSSGNSVNQSINFSIHAKTTEHYAQPFSQLLDLKCFSNVGSGFFRYPLRPSCLFV